MCNQCLAELWLKIQTQKNTSSWRFHYKIKTCSHCVGKAYTEMHVLTLYSAHTGRSIFSASTEPPTHTYAYMRKSSAKHLDHLKCSRLVLWFQGQTTLTSPSTASNEESILRTPWLLAFTFSFNTPFQLCQSICRAPQRPELWNWSGLQCSQKTNKQTPTKKP